MGKWIKVLKGKELEKQIEFDRKTSGERYVFADSSWGNKAFLIIVFKAKKVMGLYVNDKENVDKILIAKPTKFSFKLESFFDHLNDAAFETLATYSANKIKRITEIETSTKLMSKIINYKDRWKRLKEVKLGIEFDDKKWGTILINFKTDRNKNIKRAKLLTGLSTGADAPF